MSASEDTNIAKAVRAWGGVLPAWVRTLASFADERGQRAAADLLDKSSGYVSRIINNKYTGSYAEAERLVRALDQNTLVPCPIWGKIPLASCMSNRRRKARPVNFFQRQFAEHCPTCRFNPDIDQEEE